MPALAALPDTVAAAVHDTIVVCDTVFHYLGRAPDPFPVKVVDRYSWAVTFGSALISALIGAVVGGLLAIRASKGAIHDEWKLDREEDLGRLLKRVRSNLRRVQKLRDYVRDHPPDTPFPPDVGDGLEVLWNTYYRLADPIFSLGDDGLSERIDDFFQEVRRTGLLIRTTEDGAKVSPGQARWLTERTAQKSAIARFGDEAERLLGDVAGR